MNVMTMRALCFLLGLGLLASFALAEEPMRAQAGDALVSGSSFQPYTNLWRMSAVTSSGKQVADLGTWSDDLDYVTVNGRRCLQRTQLATFLKDGTVIGRTRTVNVFDPETLAPISRSFTRHSATGDETTRLLFSQRSIHMEVTSQGKTVKNDLRLDTPVFDFYGGMYGLLLAGFPLKPGFSATFPSVDEDKLTMSWVTFRVTGQEMADAGPKGNVETWVVESNTNQGPMKFWLAKEKPYIIRLEFKAGNGTLWTYRMI